MKKILLFGTNGMLGYAMKEWFSRADYTLVAHTRETFDIAKSPLSEIESTLKQSVAVINAAGVIKPRMASMPLEDILRVNCLFPKNLAKLAKKYEVPCFHVTTDCAYNGKRGNYSESDAFDAEDLYGMSKVAGETAECMTLRTSIIGEEKGQSRSLLEWTRSQKGKQVNGFTNHRWNGVTTLHLAELIGKILSEGLYQTGIFHVHSPHSVNKFELVQMLSETYELDLKINATEATEFCDRTLTSNFAVCERLKVKPLPQQIQEMREFFKKS